MEHGLLQGAYDLHIHTGPDVAPRKCTDLQLGERLTAAKMAGCALKCHHNDTAARAILLQERFPDLQVTGGVTLNRTVGGLNPYAVETSAKIGGKLVWFPTLDSVTYQLARNPELGPAQLASLLSVVDEGGKLLPAVLDVLDAAKSYNLVVGTGHLAPEDGMKIVREASRRGICTVLTHADGPPNRYCLEQMREAVGLGAMVEFSYFTVFYKRTPIEDMAASIRALGIENVLPTSDLGQTDSPYSDEGINIFITLLLKEGFSEKEIRQMFHENPRRLVR